ncbi:MAG: hypothetical protein HLUCCO17_17230 [Saliniramus fredricksonii]|uniref:Uncharacterized protein n=1 Tax=Saliniramus fredricksonii TaxID=1653334 RepID=A0A0P7XMX5_9HYPH|nr:hypothetical protein [Saliniramus fredricksonii]KPQ08727.1 MAG: hypothetical protein HLUCCO17_17230 [Saliniramus fredricksonii]SCC81672.1 hypothetical protein GA0071312_2631 [Saliniramus fredricksonii]
MIGSIVVLMAVVSLWLGLRAPRGLARNLLLIGPGIVIISVVPLLAGIFFDPEGRIVGNAQGLGFIAFFGLAAGGIVMIAGFVARALRG